MKAFMSKKSMSDSESNQEPGRERKEERKHSNQDRSQQNNQHQSSWRSEEYDSGDHDHFQEATKVFAGASQATVAAAGILWQF